MRKSSLKQAGLIGLALISLLFVINWSSHAHATSSDEARPNNDIQLDTRLLTEIQENGRAGYLIYFVDKADLSPAYQMDWERRGHFVVDTLQATAENSQKNVRSYLDRQNVNYKHFWIDNIIVVESSGINTLNALLTFSEIAAIQAMTENFLIEPERSESEADHIVALPAPEPNLVQVKATDVWALGFRGEGTVIANIDSGVRHTHEALVKQYRGNLGGGTFSHNYNWLDPDGGSTAPVDTNGHGTHVMGTMVGYDGGANEIGVAPEAQWIACRGCVGSSCPQPTLLACAEWITAPYPTGDPGSPNPNMRPLAVNNSWGNCEQFYNPWYQGAVDAWHAAGIFPIFANGNARNCTYPEPPGLNTVGNPARYGNVTGVGSSGTSNGQYAPHSNWGPTSNPDTVNPQPGWADLKPQVVAPGVNIRSSVPGSDSDYESSDWTGTSMSAPHVTGMIALMWQAAPCLIGNYADTETIIEQTAVPILYDDLGSGARWPNYAAGWGEIDLLAAVNAAQDFCGPTGTIQGLVTAAGSGTPLLSANIEASLSVSASRSTTTKADGAYTIQFAQVGVYTMTASLFGYLPTTVTDVEVISGATTVQDFALQLAPGHTVSGQVTDANTGWPLYASIAVGGSPHTYWTDPVDGSYSIHLPAGMTHTLHVNAWSDGYLAENRSLDPLSADVIENFALDIDAVACNAPGYVPTYAYFENFESGYDDWTMSGLWQAQRESDVCGSQVAPFPSPVNAAYYGDEAASCTFNVGATSGTLSLVDPVTIPGSGAVLRYWSYEETECNGNCSFDKRYTEISTDGGSSWTIIGAGEIEGVWHPRHFDLTPYAGEDLHVRFRFISFDGAANDFFGWMVDDVAVYTACEPAAGSLQADPALLVVNLLPDTMTSVPLHLHNPGDLAADFWIVNVEGSPSQTFAGPGVYDADPLLRAGVPWLSTDPIAGTVAANSSQIINVTFDATLPEVTGLGLYTATLQIFNDTVHGRLDVPVTMRVVDVLYGVKLDPAMATATADPGESLVYTLTITNTGTESDTFDLELTGHNWASNLSTNSVTLAAGESTTFMVTVHIPAILPGPERNDLVTVTAVSTNDPFNEATATAELTTAANKQLWLPIISRP